LRFRSRIVFLVLLYNKMIWCYLDSKTVEQYRYCHFVIYERHSGWHIQCAYEFPEKLGYAAVQFRPINLVFCRIYIYYIYIYRYEYILILYNNWLYQRNRLSNTIRIYVFKFKIILIQLKNLCFRVNPIESSTAPLIKKNKKIKTHLIRSARIGSRVY